MTVYPIFIHIKQKTKSLSLSLSLSTCIHLSKGKKLLVSVCMYVCMYEDIYIWDICIP